MAGDGENRGGPGTDGRSRRAVLAGVAVTAATGIAGCLATHSGDDPDVECEDPPPVRCLSVTTVAPGERLTVTLKVAFDGTHERVTITDGYVGPVSVATIDAVTTDGSEGDPFFTAVNDEELTVALREVDAGGTVAVTYTVTVDDDAADGETITFAGADGADVTAGDERLDFGVDEVSVSRDDASVERTA